MLKLPLKGCTSVKCSVYYLHYLVLQCSHYLVTHRWLHLVDILVVKCRKKTATKVGVSSRCCGHLHGQENVSLPI